MRRGARPIVARLGAALAAALAGALAVAGCNLVYQLGIPGVSIPFSVQQVTPRGSYLDALLAREGLTLRVFTPNDASCRAVLVEHATLPDVDLETSGHITADEHTCVLAGRGDLDQRRQPRPPGAALPRGRATFAPFYADEEVILARGRFPLTGLVGWARGDDSVAVLPNTAACRQRVAERIGTIEYRPSGDPLVLVGDGPEGCPLLGLARPL